MIIVIIKRPGVMMEKGVTEPSILVAADDFTRVNDAGVSLAQVGHIVDVASETHCCGDANVWVINSDNWVMDSKLAAMKVTSLTSHLPLANNPPFVIKKIDSMLRGDTSAEIEVLMKVCGMTGAVVTPAFLQTRRTTVAGECWINGVRITETEFASDSKTPVLGAQIIDTIRLQTVIPYQSVTVSQFSRLSYEQPWISVIDTQTDSDLNHIAAVVVQAKQPLLLVGPAGICDVVVRRSAIMPPPTVLAIISLMSEIVRRQIAILHSHSCIT